MLTGIKLVSWLDPFQGEMGHIPGTPTPAQRGHGAAELILHHWHPHPQPHRLAKGRDTQIPGVDFLPCYLCKKNQASKISGRGARNSLRSP